MFNSPITGIPDLDAFLYDVKDSLENTSSSSGTSTSSSVSGYGAVGTLAEYSKRYIHVKYADDNVGTNLSNTPTNKAYVGLANSVDATPESTNPADYKWVQVTGGMGTTKRFWYKTVKGKYLDYVISNAAPDLLWAQDLGGAIDLTIEIQYDGSTGRRGYAVASVNQLASLPLNLSTFGSTTMPPVGTWGYAETWTDTIPSVGATEVLFQIDGLYNPNSNITTWGSPYLSSLRVGSLSAISANMGTITAGTIRLPATGNTYMILDGANNRLDVYNAGVLRVRLGNLN
jgi:hypothetical protein